MGYKGHKDGSRKETIHRLFDEQGLAAAMAKGIELGLAATTVKSWAGTWAKRDGIVLPKTKIERASITKPSELAKLTGRKRVYVFTKGDAECLATLVSEGSEVSLVKFDRDDLFGREGNVSNRNIYPAEKSKPA